MPTELIVRANGRNFPPMYCIEPPISVLGATHKSHIIHEYCEAFNPVNWSLGHYNGLIIREGVAPRGTKIVERLVSLLKNEPDLNLSKRGRDSVAPTEEIYRRSLHSSMSWSETGLVDHIARTTYFDERKTKRDEEKEKMLATFCEVAQVTLNLREASIEEVIGIFREEEQRMKQARTAQCAVA